ncbi:putative quinol monooxygenase [Lentzea sp. CC55]|uniref:putative quinol monooxygenase n=1 Tax=Lentzea sp. CC55 TaxID=2884909 RepID=UPI001F48FA32|nr:putative quinol monooxygenase [Lentzea sp. CC55]MCG8927604.1 antibiotic biosynthesis monooxygenase [Lentzea sp. CC55]
MIALAVSLRVKPGHREPFLTAAALQAESSFAEPGCTYFDVAADTADEHHFVLYELYADQAALDAHRASPHFAAWRASAAEHLVPGSLTVTTAERLLHHA